MKSKSIVLPQVDNIFVVNLDDIIYCKAENSYIKIFTTHGDTITLAKSLNRFQEDFLDKDFLRISQTYIANRFFIRSINKRNKLVHLINEIKVPYTISLKNLIDNIEHYGCQ